MDVVAEPAPHADGLDAVVLDVNETLTDLTPLADVFARIGAPGAVAGRWFTAILQTGFAWSMAGTPRPFGDVAAALLPRMLHGLDLAVPLERAVEAVYAGLTGLALHPDVPDGLQALAGSELRVITFTNGGQAHTRQMLERYGLLHTVEQTLSVDDAPAWKPDPRAYQYALRRLKVRPAQALMVAVHPWDLHGAHQVGMRTAWLDRSGAPYPSLGSAPDIAVDSLVGLAIALG